MTLDQANSHYSRAVPANETRAHAETLINYVLKASCKCAQFAGNKDDAPTHPTAPHDFFQGDLPLMNIRVQKCS